MKLYRMMIEFEAVVMAEDEDQAEEFVHTIVDTETPYISLLEIKADSVKPNSLSGNWILNSLLYHSGEEDMTVAQAIEQIKSN